MQHQVWDTCKLCVYGILLYI